MRNKNALVLAVPMFRHAGLERSASFSLAILRTGSVPGTGIPSAPGDLPLTLNFSCVQTVQPDLAGLINRTPMTPSSKMFYCSNEARALRGGSHHYVHLTAKEMEAEI